MHGFVGFFILCLILFGCRRTIRGFRILIVTCIVAGLVLAVLSGVSSSFKAAPAPDANPMSVALADAASVRELQTLLKEVGYDPGQIDGIDGPATRKAIRDYLRVQGLPDTDVPSTALLLRLRAGKSHVPQ